MSKENQDDSLNKDVNADFVVDLSKPPKAKETEEEIKLKEEEEAKLKSEEEAKLKAEEEEKEKLKEEDDKVLVDGVSTKPATQLSKEELISKYLTDKYDIGVNDLEKVLSNKDKKTDLPKEVEEYLQYKEETKGRGLKDFVKAHEDYSKYDESYLLKEYMKQRNPELDDSDVEYLIEDRFTVMENQDDERDIRRKSLDRKQELHRAKQYFEDLKGKYKAPLESSTDALPEEAKKAVEFYQQYSDDKSKEQETIKAQREVFESKTSDFFTKEFKGFEFKLGDKSIHYSPTDLDKTVDSQMNLSNFVNKFLDDDGLLNDAKKYHTALSMAMNPEAYAKFFYEQGKADSVKDVVKDGKNINMSIRKNVESSRPGPKFTVLEDNSSNSGAGLRIKKR
tara:strand:+ start:1562 stop:2740 length:1179 start_codon:yes stop_codon:yes gene_type:complete